MRAHPQKRRIASIARIAIRKEGNAVSYIRGKLYVWDDGDNLHLWTGPTKDNDYKHKVAIKWSQFDELVMMRYYELDEKQRIRAHQRAIKKYAGNVGAQAAIDADNT